MNITVVVVVLSMTIIISIAGSIDCVNNISFLPPLSADGKREIYGEYYFSRVDQWIVQFDLNIERVTASYIVERFEAVFRYPNAKSKSFIEVAVGTSTDGAIIISFLNAHYKRYAASNGETQNFKIIYAKIEDKCYFRCRDDEGFTTISSCTYFEPVSRQNIRYYENVTTAIGKLRVRNLRLNGFLA